MNEIALMFGIVLLQNATFTLVSRARNSSSILYHGLASVGSNGMYLLVLRNVVTNLDNMAMMGTYLVASVIGSLGMHWVAMRFFERKP